MNTPVHLTYSEMRLAAEIGVQRQAQNIRDGRRDRYGLSSEDGGWTPHIEGAAGEMAVAKYLKLYWNGAVGNLKADDVGGFQVRTRSRHHYDLIIHPEDADEKRFILVTGRAPDFIIRGWITGAEGKAVGRWDDPAKDRPAFFVPQSALHPMDLLYCDPNGLAFIETPDDLQQGEG